MKTINIREIPLSEIIDLPINRWADCFPMLERTPTKREEGKSETLTLAELADSIIRNGLQEPIVLFNGTILDGRNRRAACAMAADVLEKTPEEFLVLVEDFEGSEDEAKEYVKALNLDRRDLKPSSRAVSALKWWDLEAAESATRRGGDRGNQYTGGKTPNLGGSQKTGETAEVLAADFKVSKGYIEDARREQKRLIEAREAAERARQRAEEYELEAEVAFEEVKDAAEAGDEERARAANLRANTATNKKAEEQEQAARLEEKVAKKARLLDELHAGKKNLSEVRKEQQAEGKDERELAISKAAAKFNDGYTKVMDAGPFLLKEGRLNDQENVRLKYQEICNRFSHLEEVEGARQTQYYFEPDKDQTTNLVRWASEVRVRLGGIDKIIQEHDVVPQDVAAVPEFGETLSRILLFLAEVEEILHNEE